MGNLIVLAFYPHNLPARAHKITFVRAKIFVNEWKAAANVIVGYI